MRTKLTLRIDEELIERAKSHARQSGKSVSQLVSDYLQTLPQQERTRPRPLTPILESLRGVLAGSGLDEEDYRRHVEENWSPGFFDQLSAVDPETVAAVDELLAAVRQARKSKLRRRLQLGLALALPLLWTLSLSGCKESPAFVKAGPRFAAVEKAPPGKTLVYFFWPRDEPGPWKRIWIEPCDENGEQIRRGEYTVLAVEPGPSCFKARAQWDLRFVNGFTLQDLGRLELSAEADQLHFVRVEQRPFLLTTRVELRPVQRSEAEFEIRRCRRTVPLSPEEIAREFERQYR